MNKKLFLTLATGIFTLLSCSDNVVETEGYNSPIETRAKLTVKVQDAVTGEMLNAGVSVAFPGIVGKQLSSGPYVFEDVYVGEYNVVVSAGADYADVQKTVNIRARTVENVHIARDTAVVVDIYPLNAGLEGLLRYTNKDNVLVHAPEDVKMQLHLNSACPVVNKIYDAKTTDKGTFKFDNLPAAPLAASCSFELYALGADIGGIPFLTKKLTIPTGIDLKNNTKANSVGNVDLVTADKNEVFVVTGYPAVVELGDVGKEIVFDFSADIEKANLKAGTITIDQAADIVVGTNTVTFKPAGKWDGTITITFNNLMSVNGNSFGSPTAASYPITVRAKDISKIEMKAVTAKTATNAYPEQYFRINNHHSIISATTRSTTVIDSVKQTDTLVQLTWNKVDGATGYCVYRKTETDDNYKLRTVSDGKCNPVDDTTYSADIDVSFGKTVKFLVQAVNSQYVSVIKDANALVLKDNISETWIGSYTSENNIETLNFVTDPFGSNPRTLDMNGNSLTTYLTLNASARVCQFKVYFNEAMNTDDSLDVKFLDNGGANANAFSKFGAITYEWMDNTPYPFLQLRIAVPVNTANAETDLNAKIVIKDLKDKAGNKFVSEFREAASQDPITGAWKTKPTNNLVIQLTATQP